MCPLFYNSAVAAEFQKWFTWNSPCNPGKGMLTGDKTDVNVLMIKDCDQIILYCKNEYRMIQCANVPGKVKRLSGKKYKMVQ